MGKETDPDDDLDGGEFIDIDPVFSKRAAVVLGSRYWTDCPDDELMKRSDEKQVLFDAIHTAESYDDLTGRPKELFDAAESIIKRDFNDADMQNRIGGGDGSEYSDFGMPVLSDNPLTAAEQKMLADAIKKAKADKHGETIAWLQDPTTGPSAIRHFLLELNAPPEDEAA